MPDDRTMKVLRNLMKKQNFAVLATFHDDEPYTNLVGFASSDDLRYIFFVTPVATKKYTYLRDSGKASIMIDNRSNRESDLKDAIAVNATGTVTEVEKTKEFREIYLRKHPYLTDFLESPSSAMMRMEVHRYIIASRFQNVVEIDMR
ncbi:pyridoxamine 5'-phosphate oxidase family protein [Methanolobus profundi]|uniref:Pyridoxamine 5'-phosphate oxidase n=1 Tax=Methanolobus profundi TaxID=487685 RepID=A0A1I4PPZ7_9EURY|nr:pyridoxamine 5'-phosphate oxidase family protein [Methanolobus profundi]SFM29455.1 Pyridoxamine 5'-phosphate oxidase [Methanolobus profundi]